MQTQPVTATPDLTPRATDVAHGWLRSPVYAELEAEADRRGLHPDALTAKLLTAVLTRGLVGVILDRGSA